MPKLLAYLQLCRLAAVFTALADIFLGYLLTHQDLSPPRDFGLLLVASAGLYLAGMVFNDVFDRKIDAEERPNRPIPSGRVPLRSAITFGSLLLLIGIAAAAGVGTQCLIVASLIVGAVFLYDGLLKSTPVSPLAMGSCRFLNVMLGASMATPLWAMPQVFVAAALGIYITGVTWFARREAGVSSRWQLTGALAVINVGIMLLVAFVLHWQNVEMDPRSWNAALILAATGVIINRRLINAVIDPQPAKVQLSVRTLLMSLVMLDAALVFFINPDRTYAFAVAGLLVPALMLGRFLTVT